MAIAVLAASWTPAHAQRFVQLTWVDRSGEPIETIGERGEYRGPDVSPDGERLAVHRHDGSGGDIWLFDADGNATRLVADATGVQDNSMPIWSPDGTRIAFGSLRNGVSGLYVKSADGTGDEEQLVESGFTIEPMSWSPDGRHIVYWQADGTEWVVPLDGDRTPFRLMDAQSSHSQISPDGNWVAYMSNGEVWLRGFPDGSTARQVTTNFGFFPRWRADGQELYFLSNFFMGMIMAVDVIVSGDSIETSEPRPLFESGYVNLGHPSVYHTFAVTPDGERFLIPRPEPDTLVVVDRDGDVVSTLDSAVHAQPAFSPDGRRVATVEGNRGIWVFDIATGRGAEITAVDNPMGAALSPLWSPDGGEIAYLARDRRSESVYRIGASGDTEPELVFTFPGLFGELVDWSRDGRFLLYYSAQLGGNVLFRLSVGGEPELEEIARFDTPMLGPAPSPDGRHIAYRTNALGTEEIWIRSIEQDASSTSQPILVDKGRGMVAWREDGGELYYVAEDRGFMAVEIHGAANVEVGEPRKLFPAPDGITNAAPFDGLGAVSRDGRQFALAVPPDIPPPALREMRVLDREGRVVAVVGDPGIYFGRPMISPDGTKVAAGLADIDRETGELWAFDLETDARHLLVTDPNLGSWIWSDDGTEIVYVSFSLDDGTAGGVYRIAADGSGNPELIYRHLAGTGINLIDWSADGRFVSFLSGGVLFVLPLHGDGEPVELIREEYEINQALLSPDNRHYFYGSNETERVQPYLHSFDPDTVAMGPATEKWQLSEDGSGGPHSWGRNGREVTYRNAGDITAVELTFSPELSFGPPRVLFRQPEGAGNASASRNGERWVFFAPAVDAR